MRRFLVICTLAASAALVPATPAHAADATCVAAVRAADRLVSLQNGTIREATLANDEATAAFGGGGVPDFARIKAAFERAGERVRSHLDDVRRASQRFYRLARECEQS